MREKRLINRLLDTMVVIIVRGGPLSVEAERLLIKERRGNHGRVYEVRALAKKVWGEIEWHSIVWILSRSIP